MTIGAGTKLGAYEIVALVVGIGSMDSRFSQRFDP